MASTFTKGMGVQRALPPDVGHALRHYEMCFVKEEVGGSQDGASERDLTLAESKMELRYLAVSAGRLYVIERGGYAPEVRSVDLRDITNVQVAPLEVKAAKTFADRKMAEAMTEIRISYLADGLEVTNGEGEEVGDPETDFKATEAVRGAETARSGSFFRRLRSLVKGTSDVTQPSTPSSLPPTPQLLRAKDPERQLVEALRPPSRRIQSFTDVAQDSASKRRLLVTTIEPATRLGVYLRQALHAAHAGRVGQQLGLANSEAELAEGEELHLEGQYTSAELRELFYELEEAILEVHSVYDIASPNADAIEDLGCAARYSNVLKDLFFRSHKLRAHLSIRMAAWAILAGQAHSEGEQVDDVEKVETLTYFAQPEPEISEATSALLARHAARVSPEADEPPSSEGMAESRWERLLRKMMKRLATQLLLRTMQCLSRVLTGSEDVAARRVLAIAPKPHDVAALMRTTLGLPALSGQRAHLGRGFHAGAPPARPAVGIDRTSDGDMAMSVGSNEEVWRLKESTANSVAGGRTTRLLSEASSSDDTIADLIAQLVVSFDDVLEEAWICGEAVQGGCTAALVLNSLPEETGERRVRALFERAMGLLLRAKDPKAEPNLTLRVRLSAAPRSLGFEVE